jgi:hypothetical protein
MELLTSNSTYFSISEPKAKLMTRYGREMTLITSDSSDLTKKKVKVCAFVIQIEAHQHHNVASTFERNSSSKRERV